MAFKEFTGIFQFDFQINRILTYGELACNENEIKKVAGEIKDTISWHHVWNKLGKKAQQEERFLHSAYYYRLAEFFIAEKENKSEKNRLYNLCIENFKKVILSDRFVKEEFVPYKEKELKVLLFTPEISKGTIVLFGGYDSFIEEFYLAVKEFMEAGYKIILFEGPGQGLSLKKGLTFEYRWERPLGAILDFYKIEEATVIGISWGGYLALRGCAFDKRIKKVVAYDVLYDGFNCMTNPLPSPAKQIIRLLFLLRQKPIINLLLRSFMKKKIIIDWVITHGQYITGTNNPYDFYRHFKKHTLKRQTKKITCDVLLLAGERDHYIPLKHYTILMKKLKNAQNLEGRVFTVEEGGEQHCQVGNHRLAVDHIINWIS